MSDHKKILLVEDETDIREAMAEALQDADFDVTTAADGQEGLQTALSLKPDLILLDIRMPLMDGIEVLGELRKDPWGSTAKVIVMTAMDDVTNIANAHNSAIEDYLIKTHTSLDELVRKVRLTLI